jgi:hypothetical protein
MYIGTNPHEASVTVIGAIKHRHEPRLLFESSRASVAVSVVCVPSDPEASVLIYGPADRRGGCETCVGIITSFSSPCCDTTLNLALLGRIVLSSPTCRIVGKILLCVQSPAAM